MPLTIKQALTIASAIPARGKSFARPLSHKAPQARAQMLAAEIVRVVRIICA